MTFEQLAEAVTKREGKKKNLSIAQVKEVLKVIVDLEAEHLTENSTQKGGPISVLSGRAFEQFQKGNQ